MSILSDWLLKLQGFKCAVLGENIEDEYVTVIPRGMTQGLRTYEEIARDAWEGGVLLIRHHLQALGATVEIEVRGDVRKTRYQTSNGRRLFSLAQRRSVKFPLSQSVPSQKYIICADYGHGAFDQDYIDLLCASDKFIALTVQANSLNCKENRLTRWPRADYVIINQEELSLLRDTETGKYSPVIFYREATRLKTRLMVVTYGGKGCIAFDDGEFSHWPARCQAVVDTLGAGDTLLAVTAPLVCLGAPTDMIMKIGSIAAGLHCGKRGNPTLKKEELFESL